MTKKSKEACIGCEYREIGCHANCKPYKEYKKIMDKIRENRREEYPLIGYLVDKRWR